jgi:hypothetical protein
LQDNKLSYDSITKVAAIKVKMAAPISGIKEPGHQTMQFTINRARGELKQIVSALETIQRTPYEHRVKSMTIDRAQSGFAKTDRLLIVTLTLEVMLVAKTENKVGDILANSKLRDAVRLPQGRDYALINERNIFIGAEENIVKNLLPPEKIKKQEVIFLPPEKGPERAKIDIEVWKHVRMSQTTPDRDEVHFRNIAYESPEFVVVANKKGYDTYRVMTEDKKHEFCNFKVLRVDLHQIYLQVRDQVHVMQFRQSLFEALQTPATERQLFWAGVKADARWGEEEKSKAKNPFVGKFPPRGKGK